MGDAGGHPAPEERFGRPILNVSGMTGKQLLPGALTTTLPNSSIIASRSHGGELGKEGITVNNICPGIVEHRVLGPRAEMMAKVRSMTVEQIRQMFSTSRSWPAGASRRRLERWRLSGLPKRTAT